MKLSPLSLRLLTVGLALSATLAHPLAVAQAQVSPTMQINLAQGQAVDVSWAQISRLFQVESCGSCTIDAMYVQGERFNRYLPMLYYPRNGAVHSPQPDRRVLHSAH
jgi:hypothetical protein